MTKPVTKAELDGITRRAEIDLSPTEEEVFKMIATRRNWQN